MNGFNLDDFEPSWVNTGGVSGIEPAYPPFQEDDSDWDLNCETYGGQPEDDYNPPC